ncbi:hypothetical protein M8C21_000885, partial [Ambrosia artemisiifolia]
GGLFSSNEVESLAEPNDDTPISHRVIEAEDGKVLYGGVFFAYGSAVSYWFTPNGSRYWKPIVEDSVKPNMVARYREWEDVVAMYESYGEKCGFSTRLGTVKRVKSIITHRNEHGVKAKLCNVTSMWEIYHFEESHNHMLVLSYSRDLTKIGRKLDFATKEFIHRIAGGVHDNSEVRAAIHKLCFDTTMDTQRYNQRVAEFNTDYRVPEFKTSLAIEKHCAKVYSQTIFNEVRKEIQKGLLLCVITKHAEVHGVKEYTVTHIDKNSDVVNDFTVRVNSADGDTTCSCNSWTRIGYLCRHIFYVFRYTKVEAIPEKYILDRWRREVLPKSVFSIDARYGVDNSASAVMRNELFNLFTQCVDRLNSDPDRLSTFAEQLKGLIEGVMTGGAMTRVNQRL